MEESHLCQWIALVFYWSRKKGTEVLQSMCSSGGPRLRRKATASNLPRGKKQADETFQADEAFQADETKQENDRVEVAGECTRDAGDRRRAAARPAKRRRPRTTAQRWSAALASQDRVGCLLLNPDRRIRIRWLPRARGWTVNEIPSTPGRCECRPPPPAVSRERASEPSKHRRCCR